MMHMRSTSVLLMLIAAVVIASCTRHKNSVTGLEGSDSTGERLIEKQKELVKDEAKDIDAYIQRAGLVMKTSQTGLRFNIETSKSDGDSLRPMDEVGIEYEVSLLSGELVYASDSTGKLNLIIGRSDLATGLQEGLQLMKTGDQALFLLPSHLAYGLTGDGDKIRGYQPLIIRVKSVEKINSSK